MTVFQRSLSAAALLAFAGFALACTLDWFHAYWHFEPEVIAATRDYFVEGGNNWHFDAGFAWRDWQVVVALLGALVVPLNLFVLFKPVEVARRMAAIVNFAAGIGLTAIALHYGLADARPIGSTEDAGWIVYDGETGALIAAGLAALLAAIGVAQFVVTLQDPGHDAAHPAAA